MTTFKTIKSNLGAGCANHCFEQRNLGMIIVFVASLGLLLISCNKDADHPAPPDFSNLTPAVTPKGEVIAGGISISQSVGTGGGTVQSPGGEIKVEIPAGALTGTQTIGIQEITNTAPLGAGKSFRLTPEGITFAKPVKITTKYDNIPAMFAWIVTQQADGTWLGDTRAVADEAAGTVTVETIHFSDWANGRVMDLRMAPESAVVGVKQTRQIAVTGFLKPAAGGDDDELVPLTPIHPKEEEELAPIPSMEQLLQLDRYSAMRVTRWSLDGATAPTQGNKGSLQSQNLGATYTAPAQVPSPNNPVQVAATIEAERPGGGSTTAILFSNITIVDGYFMKITFDGNAYMFDQTNATVAFTPGDDEKLLLQAVGGIDFMLSLKIMGEALDFSGHSRTYTKGDESSSLPYTVELVTNGISMNHYNIKYTGIPYLGNCIPDADSETFVPVTLAISRTETMAVPGAGTLYDVQGSFSVDVFYYDPEDVPCGPAPSHTLTGEFYLQGMDIP